MTKDPGCTRTTAAGYGYGSGRDPALERRGPRAYFAPHDAKTRREPSYDAASAKSPYRPAAKRSPPLDLELTCRRQSARRQQRGRRLGVGHLHHRLPGPIEIRPPCAWCGTPREFFEWAVERRTAVSWEMPWSKTREMALSRSPGNGSRGSRFRVACVDPSCSYRPDDESAMPAADRVSACEARA